MLKVLNIFELVVAVLLIVSILIQNRGAGLSQTFGGGFGGYYTRRGFERFLSYFSIFLSAAFIILAIINILISKVAE
jgi:protein translocase SecG subunit